MSKQGNISSHELRVLTSKLCKQVAISQALPDGRVVHLPLKSMSKRSRSRIKSRIKSMILSYGKENIDQPEGVSGLLTEENP